jgi:hypothetical protein
MTEVYKLIADTENVYSVSTLGNVKNNTTDYVLKPFADNKGYLQFDIKFSNRSYGITIAAHRLVARAFIPNPLNMPVINHLDGVKHNNRVENLEWTTYRLNNLHAVDMGLIASGEDSYLHKLVEDEVIQIIDLLKQGFRNVDIAREFNVAHNTIDDIRRNRTWRFIERDPILGNGPVKKLTGEDIPEIRRLLLTMQCGDIANMYSVAPATIYQIKIGKTWKNY